jgi:hypothetical protein
MYGVPGLPFTNGRIVVKYGNIRLQNG